MTTLEVLRGVEKLLEDPKAWRQEDYAGRRIGEDINGGWEVIADAQWDDPKANCFCLLGAISRVANGGRADVREELARTIKIAPGGVVIWNDNHSRTHTDVLAAVRGAIERLEGQANLPGNNE